MGNLLPAPVAKQVDTVNNSFSAGLPGSRKDGGAPSPWSPEGKSPQVIRADLSDCMLEAYSFTVLGLAIGLPLGWRKRNYWPTVTAGALGSFADLYDSYSRRCVTHLNAYRACKDAEDRKDK
jgi:hypothetical protein